MNKFQLPFLYWTCLVLLTNLSYKKWQTQKQNILTMCSIYSALYSIFIIIHLFVVSVFNYCCFIFCLILEHRVLFLSTSFQIFRIGGWGECLVIPMRQLNVTVWANLGNPVHHLEPPVSYWGYPVSKLKFASNILGISRWLKKLLRQFNHVRWFWEGNTNLKTSISY